ncbi:MAG: response regulator transcription factor [Vulcanimicrobiaceae bacterium]
MPWELGAGPEATVAVDDRGIIVAWNRAAELLLGWTAEQAIGRPCHEIMHGSTSAGTPICGPDCAILECGKRGNTPRRFEMLLRRPDQTEVWLDVTSVTLRDSGRTLSIHVFNESLSVQQMSKIAGEVTQRLVLERASAGPSDENLQRLVVDRLTRREIEVLKLVAAGLGTNDIAAQLHVARVTVRNHINSAMAKLGAHSRLEVGVIALKAGLVHLH